MFKAHTISNKELIILNHVFRLDFLWIAFNFTFHVLGVLILNFIILISKITTPKTNFKHLNSGWIRLLWLLKNLISYLIPKIQIDYLYACWCESSSLDDGLRISCFYFINRTTVHYCVRKQLIESRRMLTQPPVVDKRSLPHVAWRKCKNLGWFIVALYKNECQCQDCLCVSTDFVHNSCSGPEKWTKRCVISFTRPCAFFQEDFHFFENNFK